MARALTELSPLELLEQSVAVLRAAPASAWNYYITGAAPLLVAVVFSVERFSLGEMPPEEIAGGSCILALLFFWMSWAKIRFAQGLHRQLAAINEEPAGTPRGLWTAAILQGTKLIVIPLSALAVFPFAWSVAFYGNLTALAAAPGSEARNLLRLSARQAGIWQRQNWFACGLVALFALVVFLNVVILLGLLPILARTFSGYENEFTRNPSAMFNGTFAAAALGITWFAIDPLIQAMYVVRCFKGESVGSGADLRAALRRLVVVLAFAAVTASAAHARPVTASELDAKIRQTLQKSEYSWQNPEPPADDSTPRWIEDVGKILRHVGHWVRVGFDWLDAQLRDLFRSEKPVLKRGDPPPSTGLRWTIYGVLFLIAILAALLLRKVFFAAKPGGAGSIAPAGTVDLEGDVLASELPEDEWLRLAREALARGDLRQALRAAYLANLAWLGSANLVSVSRFKSNRDYERELLLRSRSQELTSLLMSNRTVFEGAWYGDEARTEADFEDMRRNISSMRELAHA